MGQLAIIGSVNVLLGARQDYVNYGLCLPARYECQVHWRQGKHSGAKE
jgi:hypothetical protein